MRKKDPWQCRQQRYDGLNARYRDAAIRTRNTADVCIPGPGVVRAENVLKMISGSCITRVIIAFIRYYSDREVNQAWIGVIDTGMQG